MDLGGIWDVLLDLFSMIFLLCSSSVMFSDSNFQVHFVDQCFQVIAWVHWAMCTQFFVVMFRFPLDK